MSLSSNMVICLEQAPKSGLFRDDLRTLRALASRGLIQQPRYRHKEDGWVSRLTGRGRRAKSSLSRITGAEMLLIYGRGKRLIQYCG